MGAILTSIAIIYILVVSIITYFVINKQKDLKRKLIIGILITLLFYIGPFLDQIIANQYFNYLCKKDSGLFVYERVMLSEKYFKNGELIHFKGINNFFSFNLDNRYVSGLKNDKKKYYKWGIRKSSLYIKDKKESKINAEYVSFYFDGGILARKISNIMPGGVKVCSGLNDASINELIKSAFIAK